MYLEYVALDHCCQSMKLCVFQGRLWLRWYIPSDVDQTEMPSDLSVTWHMQVWSLYDSKTGIFSKFDFLHRSLEIWLNQWGRESF
jgi:hypothetical protein